MLPTFSVHHHTATSTVPFQPIWSLETVQNNLSQDTVQEDLSVMMHLVSAGTRQLKTVEMLETEGLGCSQSYFLIVQVTEIKI